MERNYKEHAKIWIEKNLMEERFKSQVHGMHEWYEIEGNEQMEEACLMVIVGSSYGQYMIDRLCEFFEIPDAPKEDDEEKHDFWDTLENYLSAIADDLKEITETEHDMYFGFLEAGDYGLFLSRPKEDDEDDEQ